MSILNRLLLQQILKRISFYLNKEATGVSIKTFVRNEKIFKCQYRIHSWKEHFQAIKNCTCITNCQSNHKTSSKLTIKFKSV